MTAKDADTSMEELRTLSRMGGEKTEEVLDD